MIVCLDTNIVVQALAEGHPFHPILDAWVAGRITWAVSTEVLLARFISNPGGRPRGSGAL
jgi:predicted nucleic acid-binding protein